MGNSAPGNSEDPLEELRVRLQNDAEFRAQHPHLARRLDDFEIADLSRKITLRSLSLLGSDNPNEVVTGIQSLVDYQKAVADTYLDKPMTPEQAEKLTSDLARKTIETHATQKPTKKIPTSF